MASRILAVCALLAAAHASFDVQIGSDFSYKLLVNGDTWLQSGPTFVTVGGHRYTTADGSLRLANITDHTGTDSSGSFTAHDATWYAGSQIWKTTIRVYTDGKVVFGQHFPSDFAGTTVINSEKVLSSFPSFQLQNPSVPLGYLSFQGDMCGSGAHTGQWDSQSGGIGQGKTGTGPLVLFSQSLNTSLVIGAFSNFMIFNQAVEDGSISFGVMGSVESIPANFGVETLVQAAPGIHTAMLAWGDTLLHKYGKMRYEYKRDFALTHLGYSTDNGAYYYYQTESGLNYEDTMIGVKKYADSVGIPYTYVLLDSWWYYKGTDAGVSIWDARPDIFPNGLEYLYNVTNWPTQLHNRYWATNTTYAKQNGGKWDFIIDANIALPTQPEFWDTLMGDKRLTGMIMYEQDWLDHQFDLTSQLQTSATLARNWMMQMGEAAARVGVTMQECMSHVRHILQSVELPAITNARASGDYHPGNGQWNLGTSSMLAHAVGIAPSKDNYWSTPEQSGTHYGPDTREPWSRMQSAVSSLSTGPVAPSDKIGGSNPSLINMACMADGTLLQPSTPAVAIDAHFVQLAFGSGGAAGEIWLAHSFFPDYHVAYVIAIDVTAPYKISVEELGFPSGTTLLAAEANKTNSPFDVNAQNPLPISVCGKEDFQLYTVSAIVGGWALLGEPSKWARVSEARFSGIVFDSDYFSVIIRGVSQETVSVGVQLPSGDHTVPSCTLPADGSIRLVVNPAGQARCDPL